MAFLARNLLFGQEATSASSAEEEIAPTPLPDTRREPCAREGCEKRATRTLQTRRNPPQSRGGGRKGSYTGDSRSRDERGGGRTGRHLGSCGAAATRSARFPAPTPSGAAAIRAAPSSERAGHLDAPLPSAFATRDAPLPKASTTRGAPPPNAPAVRGASLPNAFAAQDAPPPSAFSTRSTPPPERPAVRGARSPTPPLPSAFPTRGIPPIRRRRNPGHASARASRPPGRAASRRHRHPAPSNTGSTPRSFPRCSPCRGRPGSPACRRCGTAGSRSAP